MFRYSARKGGVSDGGSGEMKKGRGRGGRTPHHSWGQLFSAVSVVSVLSVVSERGEGAAATSAVVRKRARMVGMRIFFTA